MKSFKVTSGVIVASDPCYSIPTWCQGIIENVKNGEWIATVEHYENKIAVLMISHKDFNLDLSDMFVDEEEFSFDAGVDSGQFGFFDKAGYRQDKLANGLSKADFGDGYDKEEGDEWYRAVCDLTLGSESWGVLPDGVASSSGVGDGSYTVYGVKDMLNGEWVGLRVVFIDLETDDEDDEDEDDEF
jgi:Protein of unknown function (DUF4241)